MGFTSARSLVSHTPLMWRITLPAVVGLDLVFRAQDSGFGVLGLGFRVQGLSYKFWGLGSGLRVPGLEFWV